MNKTLDRRGFIILTPAMLAAGYAAEFQEPEPNKWIPQCWCGLTGDDVAELGDEIWRCKDRHVFSIPWGILDAGK